MGFVLLIIIILILKTPQYTNLEEELSQPWILLCKNSIQLNWITLIPSKCDVQKLLYLLYIYIYIYIYICMYVYNTDCELTKPQEVVPSLIRGYLRWSFGDWRQMSSWVPILEVNFFSPYIYGIMQQKVIICMEIYLVKRIVEC